MVALPKNLRFDNVLIPNIAVARFILRKMQVRNVRSVTGLPKSAVLDIIQKRTQARKKRKRGAPILLSPSVEVVIGLIHLRHYIVDPLMAVMFQVPETTEERTRQRILKWLYNVFKHAISMQSLRFRLQHGACRFFGTIFTFAGDGSE